MKCKPSPSYSYHPKNYVLSISCIQTITELHTIHDMHTIHDTHTVTELLYTYHAWAPTSMSSYELQYNSSISYILYSIPALYIPSMNYITSMSYRYHHQATYYARAQTSPSYTPLLNYIPSEELHPALPSTVLYSTLRCIYIRPWQPTLHSTNVLYPLSWKTYKEPAIHVTPIKRAAVW